MTQNDNKLANDLDYDRVGFPLREKDFSKIETKISICINVFFYENKLVFPIYILNQNFKNSTDLLLVTDGDIFYYVYFKDFDRFMFHTNVIILIDTNVELNACSDSSQIVL